METPPPQPEQEHPAKNKKLIIALSVFILLAILGGIYSFIHINSDTPPPPAPATSPTPPARKLVEPKVRLSLFAKGLSNPTGIISSRANNDSNLYALNRDGIINIVSIDGKVSKTPFLDIRSKVLSAGEMGLLGLAFSPNYSTDKYFYINYVDKNQNTVIARYTASSPSLGNPKSERLILRFKQPYANHNGGDLVFGTDDYLYAAVGDGGSAGDPGNRAQNLNSIFGKILRFDVSSLPYKIPPSNPFVNQPGKNALIWDYGLRNPWRLSFDRKTNDLYIADVGQNAVEELNVEPAGNKGGNNYGWRCYESSDKYNFASCQSSTKFIFPAIEYPHTKDRCSITGGYVYRGSKYPALDGKYFYGDYCSGHVYYAQKQNGKWKAVTAFKSSYMISTFGEDAAGELYLADFAAGNIYRVKDVAN